MDAPEQQYYEMFSKPGPYTKEEIDRLRTTPVAVAAHRGRFFGSSLRMNVELLGALLSLQEGIDRFNQSSTNLVNTTNRLTKWILALTVAAIIVGVLNAVPTWLVYLTHR